MVFFEKMGAMSADVPILGQDFNTWFPLTMLICGWGEGGAPHAWLAAAAATCRTEARPLSRGLLACLCA
jgi:hypothetical protein